MNDVELETPFDNSLACELLWEYPIVNLGRNEIRHCCRTNGQSLKAEDIQKHSIDIIKNSPIERENRARMLLGEKISNCSTCWAIEKNGVRSPRINLTLKNYLSPVVANNIRTQLDNLPSQQDKIQYLSNHPITRGKVTNLLEISLSNTCDMQCTYCSHHYSTKWASYRLKHSEITKADLPKPLPEYKQTFLDWFRLEGVHTTKYINFIGGEPSLIKDFYEVSSEMDQILRSINIKHYVILSVVTNLNCTDVVFEKFINHLSKVSDNFYAIDLNVSIEAFGARAEYIRYGLNWERWKKNFERLVALKNAKFVISAQMATNLLSVTSLPELLKYFWSLYEKYGVVVQLHQNIITDPPAHSPTLLTRDFSKYFDESINFLTEKAPFVDDTIDTDCRKWKKYADFLETIKYSTINHVLTHQEKSMIGQFFNKFNTRQRIDIYKTFPEYQTFFNACGIYRIFEIKLFNNYPKIFKRYMKTKVSAWHVKQKLQTLRSASAS